VGCLMMCGRHGTPFLFVRKLCAARQRVPPPVPLPVCVWGGATREGGAGRVNVHLVMLCVFFCSFFYTGSLCSSAFFCCPGAATLTHAALQERVRYMQAASCPPVAHSCQMQQQHRAGCRHAVLCCAVAWRGVHLQMSAVVARCCCHGAGGCQLILPVVPAHCFSPVRGTAISILRKGQTDRHIAVLVHQQNRACLRVCVFASVFS
jgi:hypothetical protein